MEIIEELRIWAPKESVPDSSTLLTFLDVLQTDSNPIQRCYFFSYPHPTSHFLQSHLPNIKRSLSFTLQHFYPLAGKLRLSPASSDKQYEIYYEDGDSIPLVVAESKDNLSQLSGVEPHDTSKIQPLLPRHSVDDLLAVQLTVFPNQGICIGLHICHLACDGFSYAHFVKSWASICMQGTEPLPLPSTLEPSIGEHRTVLLDSLHDFYTGFLKERQVQQEPRKPKTKAATLNATLRISNEEMEMLKESIQAKAKVLGKPLRHCSTYVVSSLYVWSCHVKLHGYSDDQKICFTFPVDWRRRLDPPAPAMYFGNCVVQSFVEMKAGDLVKEEDGLVLACEAIGNKIKELESGNIGNSIMDLGKYLANVHAGNPILFVIGYSNKFGVYGVDFGWGRPVKIGNFVDEEEGFYMAENGDDCKGVEIGVILPKHKMDQFLTIFRTGLETLSRINCSVPQFPIPTEDFNA